MREVEVLRAGPLVTVQDGGRVNQGHLGLSRTGVMDRPAQWLANWLVGNKPDAAVLEVAHGLLHLRFHAPGGVALAGGLPRARLNGRPVWPGWAIPVAAGDELELTGMRDGLYAVLAFAGGVAVPPVLGSRSTDLFAGFGGWQGRTVRAGDRLPLGEAEPPSVRGLRLPRRDTRIRVLPGPGRAELGEACWHAFLQRPWQVGSDSSRMATVLQGEPLPPHDVQQRSRMVLPGTIQLPPSGRPVVLQADAQATGGYPELALVLEWDLWKLAQARPGQTVYFQASTPEEALRVRRGWLAHFHRLREVVVDD